MKDNFFQQTKKNAIRRRQPSSNFDPFEKNYISSEKYLEYKKKHADKYAIILKSITTLNLCDN